MIIRKGDMVELWVEKMAYGGQGVARLDGFVIFVKGGVPGDRVMARVIKKKKGYANAALVEVIQPSIDRIEAPCLYSGYCGGCNYQHVRYERQLEYKKGHIKDSITRIGSMQDISIHDVIPSEKIFAYRNKMEFSFSDRRWLMPEEFHKGETDQGFGLGLHVPGSFNKVIDLDSCLLQPKEGNRILRKVKRYVKGSGEPVYGLKSHKGFWRFLVLRYSFASNEWLVNLVTSEEKRDVVLPLAEMLVKEIHNIKGVVNNINTRKAAIALGEREIILKGRGFINDKIGPYVYQVSANSFFQTNTSGAEMLYEKVVEFAQLDGSEVILDLYSGTGTIPIFLSKNAKEVIGIEISDSAVMDAKKNCVSNNVTNCSFILGDIREKLSEVDYKPGVLIIDPPRTGMHKDVLKGIMEMKVEKVIYVSCNPATMARDIGQMSDVYKVNEIQPVDMFPHTYHVESVAGMTLR